MRKYTIISILLYLFVITSCANAPVKGVESSVSKDGKIENVKVTTNKTNVRSGCSPEANVLNTANKNNEFQVINQVEDWYAVKLDNNQIGFVPSDQCTPIVKDGKDKKTPSTQTPNQTNIPNDQVPAEAPEDTSDKTPTVDTTKDTDKVALSKDEQLFVDLVNKARAENQLPSLKVDLETSDVARIKSQDMIDNNYFSHNSPTYGSPFDMLQSFGIKYVKAGENIAGNATVEAAHQALMNSPGHRKNILSPNYTHIGVGIKNGGPYQKMFTQMFLSKPQ